MLSLSKHAGGPLHIGFDGAQHDKCVKEKSPGNPGLFSFLYLELNSALPVLVFYQKTF